MKNQEILLLNVHSTVDIITNSSSEIFVCNTNKSLDFVQEILQSIHNQYNENHGYEREFDECFAPLYMLHENNVDEFIEDTVIGYGFMMNNWRGMGVEYPDFYNTDKQFKQLTGWDYRYPWSDHEAHNKVVSTKRQEFRDELENAWKEKYNDIIRKDLIGKIVIRSVSDNTIPYETWDTIQLMLNASRAHLG